MKFTAVYRKIPEGYIGFVAELPGANTRGKTLEEVRVNIREAIATTLEANHQIAAEAIEDIQDIIYESVFVQTKHSSPPTRSGQIDPEIIKRNSIKEGYAILDEMVGFCKSDQTDGSINHDEVIYELRSKP